MGSSFYRLDIVLHLPRVSVIFLLPKKVKKRKNESRVKWLLCFFFFETTNNQQLKEGIKKKKKKVEKHNDKPRLCGEPYLRRCIWFEPHSLELFVGGGGGTILEREPPCGVLGAP